MNFETETAKTARLVSRAVLLADSTKGTGILKGLMDKSPKHTLFVVRKLMCDEINAGGATRRAAVLPGALQHNPGGTEWFPLPPDQYRAEVRVKHIVDTVCLWYPAPKVLVKDLQTALCASHGDVSWLWVELAATMVECREVLRLKDLHFDVDTPEARVALTARLLSTQEQTKLPLARYLSVLSVCRGVFSEAAVVE